MYLKRKLLEYIVLAIQPQVDCAGEVAEAEPAVPGWSMPVDNLFVI